MNLGGVFNFFIILVELIVIGALEAFAMNLGGVFNFFIILVELIVIGALPPPLGRSSLRRWPSSDSSLLG